MGMGVVWEGVVEMLQGGSWLCACSCRQLPQRETLPRLAPRPAAPPSAARPSAAQRSVRTCLARLLFSAMASCCSLRCVSSYSRMLPTPTFLQARARQAGRQAGGGSVGATGGHPDDRQVYIPSSSGLPPPSRLAQCTWERMQQIPLALPLPTAPLSHTPT